MSFTYVFLIQSRQIESCIFIKDCLWRTFYFYTNFKLTDRVPSTMKLNHLKHLYWYHDHIFLKYECKMSFPTVFKDLTKLFLLWLFLWFLGDRKNRTGFLFLFLRLGKKKTNNHTCVTIQNCLYSSIHLSGQISLHTVLEWGHLELPALLQSTALLKRRDLWLTRNNTGKSSYYLTLSKFKNQTRAQ